MTRPSTAAAHPLPLALGDLLAIMPDAVVMVDARGYVVYVNPAFRGLLGYRPADIVGQPLSLLVPQASRARHEELVAKYRREGSPKMMGSRPVLRAAHCSGRLVPVSISLCNVSLGGDLGDALSVAILRDVSVLHTDLDRATAQAQTDVLTGLGNRLRLSGHVQSSIEGARPFSLLMMDLTGFKGLNDLHGHAAGDEALRIVGRRLQALVRDTDVAVRLGGDEFVLLVGGLDNPVRLREVALAAAASLARPMRLGTVLNGVGVNIGGAIFPAHGHSENELLAAADRAMYAAKQACEAYRLASTSFG